MNVPISQSQTSFLQKKEFLTMAVNNLTKKKMDYLGCTHPR